jgi:hypothetical protein
MSDKKAQAEVPGSLLSQALLELRDARGDLQATREAVIRYFKAGIASGFQVGSLMQWLFFWPDKAQSVFSQVGYSAKETSEFMDILREKHSAQELGLRDDQMPPKEHMR